MKRVRARKKAEAKAKAKKAARGTVARSKPRRRSAEEREDRLLAAEARKALIDPQNRERVPWERLKADLSL